MALIRNYTDSIHEDLRNSKGFRREFLREAVNCIVVGDVETGKVALREYVNGTVGFIPLGEALGKSSKSLMRMLSRQGNPQVRNLFEIIAYLQKAEGTALEVRTVRKAA